MTSRNGRIQLRRDRQALFADRIAYQTRLLPRIRDFRAQVGRFIGLGARSLLVTNRGLVEVFAVTEVTEPIDGLTYFYVYGYFRGSDQDWQVFCLTPVDRADLSSKGPSYFLFSEDFFQETGIMLEDTMVIDLKVIASTPAA